MSICTTKPAGFGRVDLSNLEHLYDRFMLDEGEYPQVVFICSKS
jgi:hypothetical protein